MSIMDLVRPNWRNSDANVRRNAVGKIENLDILKRVATNDPDESVKIAALDTAGKIAITSSEDAIRQEALGLILSSGYSEPLNSVAKNSCDTKIRKIATSNISSQEILFDIAMNDENSDVKIAAIARIQDQSNLAKILKSTTSATIQTIILGRIEEPSLLAGCIDENLSIEMLEKINKRVAIELFPENAKKKLEDYLRIVESNRSRRISVIGYELGAGRNGFANPETICNGFLKEYFLGATLDYFALIGWPPSTISREEASNTYIGHVHGGNLRNCGQPFQREYCHYSGKKFYVMFFEK